MTKINADKKTFEKFWILWHPDNTTPPRVIFRTREGAEAEQHRLIAQIGHGTLY